MTGGAIRLDAHIHTGLTHRQAGKGGIEIMQSAYA